MADTLRVKRRVSGGAGAPASLANAELAYNEVDHVLYYGEGTGGAGGTATVIVPIAGQGLGSTTPPVMDSTAAVGVASTWAHGDHVHPSDTSRATVAALASYLPLTGGTLTGPLGIALNTAFIQVNSTGVQQASIYFQNNGVNKWQIAKHSDDAFFIWDSTNSRIFFSCTAGTGLVTVGAVATTGNTLNGNWVTGTPATADSSTTIATTAYVKNQLYATQIYVDNAVQGIDAKASVRAASTANLTLSAPQTVDGIALIAGDRILVKNQTTTAENGIYLIAAGAWTRTTDADNWTELVSAYVFVEQGTVNADSGFLCTVDAGGTLGTTAVTWTQFNGAGSITAGAGLTKTGNVLDVGGTAARILVNADTIDIDAAYVGQTSITTLGTIVTGTWNGSTIQVNRGGSGATTLSGYLFGNGTSAFTASATIPNTAISGLGTMSTQNANAVAITGGTIDGITFDGGTF